MKFKCKFCNCETEYLVFKPFASPRRQHVGDPKYCFHIKSVCFDCHKFNGFKKQTDEFILEELNGAVMMKIDLENRLPFSDLDSIKDS